MQLDISRFYHLIHRDFWISWKRIGLYTAACFGALAVTMIIIASTSDYRSGSFHNDLFPYLLLIGGFLYTSANYLDFKSHIRRVHYLSIPASNLEKMLSHLLYTALGYPIFLIIALLIFSNIMNPICQGVFGYTFDTLQPFSGINWLLLKLYFVIQSLFFVGSIAFNRYTGLKTVISVILFVLALIAVTALLFRIIYHDFFSGLFTMNPNMGDEVQTDSVDEFLQQNIPTIAKTLFWFVLAPVLWIISYFKMIEKEA